VEAGTILADRYRLAERLGRGAMGEVWRAQDKRLYDRDVAVKMLLIPDPDAGALERFAREAGVAARLSHPGITVVHDIGQHEDRVFIVMELLRGENLGTLLSRHSNGLPVSQVISFAIQVASALASAHAAGVIHRDLKPANLFVQGDHVKICDFGLARDEAARSITMTGDVIGTPAYMAPEQWNGEAATTRTDLYALGCMIWQTLTGEMPFPGPSIAALLNQHLNMAPVPPASRVPHVPPALDDLVMSLLAKDPEQRPPSTTWVLEALTKIRDSAREWPVPGPVPARLAGDQVPAPRPAVASIDGYEPVSAVPAPQGPTIADTIVEPAAVFAPGTASRPPVVPRSTGPVTAIACAPLGPELRVFALTEDGRIRHCSLNTRGPSDDSAPAGRASAGRASAGRGSTGRDPASDGTGWTSWIDVLSPAGQQPIAAIAASSAHTMLYSLLADHNSALAAVADGGLYISRSGGAWRSMDRPGIQPGTVSIVDIAVASWTQGAWNWQPGEPRTLPSPVSVFVLDAGGQVWQNSRAGWREIPVRHPVSAIAACSFRNDDQLVLCVTDGRVAVAHYETRQGASSSLAAWRRAPGGTVVDVACLSLAADHQEAFALDEAGYIWYSRSVPSTGPEPHQEPLTWTSWTLIEGAPGQVTSITAGAHESSPTGDGDGTGVLLAATAEGAIYHASCELDTTRQSSWATWSLLPSL